MNASGSSVLRGASAGAAVRLGVAVGVGAIVGVDADVGVAVGAGGTGVAVGIGVGVGLEQAATTTASANTIVQLDSFDMEAAKTPEARCSAKGGSLQQNNPAMSALVNQTASGRKPLVHIVTHACLLTCARVVEQGLSSSA